MPTYEYACRDCGEHVEVVQSFKDAPLTTCGVCGGTLRKVFSAAGIIFKGSGYYVTDSRKAAAKGSASERSTSEGSTSEGTAASGAESSAGGAARSGDGAASSGGGDKSPKKAAESA